MYQVESIIELIGIVGLGNVITIFAIIKNNKTDLLNYHINNRTKPLRDDIDDIKEIVTRIEERTKNVRRK